MTFMDGLCEHLCHSRSEKEVKQVYAFMDCLQKEGYDTDALKDDINDDIQNSNIGKMSTAFQSIQQYVYYQRCM